VGVPYHEYARFYLYFARCRSEPWIVSHRPAMPWPDMRYRGWQLDKVQYIDSVANWGFQFRVLHDAFVIHRYEGTGDFPVIAAG
jgi:hypothetical protein